jgi:hypothetical protein
MSVLPLTEFAKARGLIDGFLFISAIGQLFGRSPQNAATGLAVVLPMKYFTAAPG